MTKLLIYAFLGLSLSVHADPVINELMPKNVSFIMDDAYNFSMWVEVHNPGATEIDMADYSFSDKLEEPEKWRPESTLISAGGFAVFYFERDERTGHASFKLDPEGGKLYLFDKNGELVDEVEYPEQYRNVSYGRKGDTGSEWVFYDEPSPGASNTGSKSASDRCSSPVFSMQSGFYQGSQGLTFTSPPSGEKVYYTLDNSEPSVNSSEYKGTVIPLDQTLVVRAVSIAEDKLRSDVVSSTFFINERKPENLRVVSISTDQRYLTNDTIGIYCDGTNGITGNLQKTPKNFNQDWDRPTNFEFFDESGTLQLNQELDIRIVGGGSRESDLKSIAISPKKKFGENRLEYDFFPSTKPGRKYKDIMMRNSGNDFKRTMMKDAFLQSMIVGRMDVDYQAYEPAVIFINGEYFGIENMRERSNRDFVFSNFGLDSEDVYLIESTYKGVDSHNDIPTDPEFIELSKWLKDHPLSNEENYQEAQQMIDVDEFINYLILQLYVANVDWPYNNMKMWKLKEDGRWRWILMDVEYSYSMGRVDHNTITFALGENSKSVIGGYDYAPEWSTIVFESFIDNDQFLQKFIDRFAIHLSTTFQPDRLIHMMDSMASRIEKEIPYHQARFGIVDNFQNDIQVWKNFASARVPNVLKHISQRFLQNASVQKIQLSSVIPGVTYQFNQEVIKDTRATISYFQGLEVSITANPVNGYKFSHWIVDGEVYDKQTYSTILTSEVNLEAVFEQSTTQEYAVVINEVMSSNQTIADEFGGTDDYIELYNTGTASVDIGGWYFSDKPEELTKSQIPKNQPELTVIGPGERLILWADEEPEQGALHLDFKLSSDGESLLMHREEASSLVLVDQVTIPALGANTVFARKSDGSPEWAITTSSWNAPNSYEILFSDPVSVIKIFPTIPNDQLTVLNGAGMTVKVMDMNGKCYLQKIVYQDEDQVNVAHLSQGIFLVQVGDDFFRIIKR
ncbi:MAG: CotH kinase family protein [Marinoscillum sp.]